MGKNPGLVKLCREVILGTRRGEFKWRELNSPDTLIAYCEGYHPEGQSRSSVITLSRGRHTTDVRYSFRVSHICGCLTSKEYVPLKNFGKDLFGDDLPE